MGEMVEFPSNGSTGQGYLAAPESGSGPGVVVIQEWWGLNDNIKDIAERFAGEGFVALAPDLYRGRVTEEPDEAGKLMMTLDMERAAKDMSGAVTYLDERSTTPGVGVTGFCMGGGMALLLATMRGDAVRACVPFYGVIPPGGPEPDWYRLSGPIQGHYAENDDFAGPAAVARLKQEVESHGKVIEVFTYPGTQHAFFNDTRPEVHDAEASALAWSRTLSFLNANLETDRPRPGPASPLP